MSDRHHQAGFTLVELIVAVVMLTIILAAVFQLFKEHNFMAAKQEETTRMQQDLLSILTLISEDIRMCGYSPNGGSFGFSNANATTLICTKDADGDGALDANANETAGYRFIDGNDTMQWYDPTTDTWINISEDIANVQFTYYDSNGIATNIIDNVRSVETTITAMTSDARENMLINNRSMATRTTCRNIGM